MKQRGIYEKVPGSGQWWVRYADETGRLRREKAGTKSAAIALYQKRKTEALQGRKLPEKLRRAPATFQQIAQDALTYSRAHKRSYRDDEYRMATLLEWFGSRPAESISPQEIEQRFGERMWAPATCNRYRALLSFIYRIAVRNGKLADNPIRKLARRRENNGRVRFLDADEEAALRAKIRELSPDQEPEFDLALHTGMRRNEQYRLGWEHVDFRLGLINVVQSKNGQCRTIPMNAAARDALQKLRQQRDDSGYVSPGTPTDRERDWRRWFEQAVREAGISDFCWHDLRHTFASRLVMAGVDLRTVAELLGHKTLAMVMRYAHLAPGHMREAIERLVPERTDTRTSTETVTARRPALVFVN
jgi:integrase